MGENVYKSLSDKGLIATLYKKPIQLNNNLI